MSLTSNDFKNIAKFVTGAFNRFATLIVTHPAQADAFRVDVTKVLQEYADAAKQFEVANPEPFPKNTLSQINWIRKNFNLFSLLFVKDPFREARQLADQVSLKWKL